MKFSIQTFIVIIMIIPSSSFSSEQTDDKDIYGIHIPTEVLDFKITKETDNEVKQKGLGHTLYYHAAGIKVSAYIYNYGYSNLQQGVESEIIKNHFKQVNNDVIYYNPSAQKLDESEERLISNIPILHSVYIFTDNFASNEELVFSHVYLTSFNKQFIKLRITYSAENQPELGNFKHNLFVAKFFTYIAEHN